MILSEARSIGTARHVCACMLKLCKTQASWDTSWPLAKQQQGKQQSASLSTRTYIDTPEKTTHLKRHTCTTLKLLYSIVLHVSGDLQHVRAVSSGVCKVLVTVINRWVGHTTMWSTTAHGVWYYIYWGLDHERR